MTPDVHPFAHSLAAIMKASSNMKVYTLMQDDKRKNTAFMTEHGLSLYFEHGGKRILFDTGASDSFIYNATLLGIDLLKVDVCVISHAHATSTGGLRHFLDINEKATVYMKHAARGDFYIKKPFSQEHTRIDPVLFRDYADRIKLIEYDAEIADGVIAANAEKYRHYPLYSSLMYKKQDGVLVHDDLAHELFVAVKTENGVVVLTGCSHHGVINILKTADEKFGRVSAIAGGFHLNGTRCLGLRHKSEPAIEVRAIAKYLSSNRIKHVYTGHCTGDKQLEKLELHARANRLYAGDILEL